MKLYIADAFTEKLFGGNPAGVVVLEKGEDFPAEDVMLKTAAELRYSETAFIKQLSDKEFKIRYFTPADEVELCGHATIASFFCLMDAGLVRDGNSYINETLAGRLNIQVQDGFVMMDMATPQYIGSIKAECDVRELYDVMGLPYEDVPKMPIEMISTGLPDIIMPVASRSVLEEICPDFERLSELSRKYDVVGVHAFTTDSEEKSITAHCRNFAPLYDIDEEAATGTSNGALSYYLYRQKKVSVNDKCFFIQGEAMKRPSKILTGIDVGIGGNDRGDDEEIKVRVGGNATILAKGEIML